jgi:hypothetical protein
MELGSKADLEYQQSVGNGVASVLNANNKKRKQICKSCGEIRHMRRTSKDCKSNPNYNSNTVVDDTDVLPSGEQS